MFSIIQYEHAFNKLTNTHISIHQVKENIKDNYKCLDCSKTLIPVLSHQTPHFRHKSDSPCVTNPESDIHKQSKEAFKLMKEINFPKINISDIPQNNREKFENRLHDIINLKVPEHFQEKFKKSLKKNLTEPTTLSIQDFEIEKPYNNGSVRIDIVLKLKNKSVFIEPYYSNSISEKKLKILEKLDIPTIAIALHPFLEKYPNGYTLQQLKIYLQSESSKTWIHIRKDILFNHTQNYLHYVHNKIKKFIKQNPSIYKALNKSDTLKKLIKLDIENKRIKIKNMQSSIQKSLTLIQTIQTLPLENYDEHFKKYKVR